MSVLPFLIEVTQRIVRQVDAAHMAPQLVGPKLFSALGNLAGLARIDAAGALSPEVLANLAGRGGEALARQRAEQGELAAANLCFSLGADADLTEQAINRLLAHGLES